MRKSLICLIALAASVTWTATASAGTWFTKAALFRTYIGSNPNGFQIGSFETGWSFYYNTDNAYGNYRWGRSSVSDAGADKCGWVDITHFGSSPYVYPPHSCSSALYGLVFNKEARQHLRAHYAKAVNDYVPGPSGPNNVLPFFLDLSDGTDNWSHYVTVGQQVWGNYNISTGALSAPQVTVVNAGEHFLWRWISDSGGVMLGRGVGAAGSGWGYIYRGAMRGDLVYADGNRRWDWQAGL